ncbi:predicted protein [Coccidioides posadasii str. Silveira]|uniref:Predicted protein n=1 Tax=Coccidioides posadasii (strain RMSCC 757 / Silveira) TaxID=443226 RepID=E9D5V8_COCPS|nr:predicted protein [Coccidioides posadasii str. Silveira]
MYCSRYVSVRQNACQSTFGSLCDSCLAYHSSDDVRTTDPGLKKPASCSHECHTRESIVSSLKKVDYNSSRGYSARGHLISLICPWLFLVSISGQGDCQSGRLPCRLKEEAWRAQSPPMPVPMTQDFGEDEEVL